ncbi:PAAR domain-containing protein [Burkholderia sp. Ac-20365]|nr:PAAR domain-containing protein [Burkholderia sp. Ac-20365]
MKALVAKGDRTTTGGTVISGSSTQYDEDRRTLAVDLDYATCGLCHDGPWRILGSVSEWTDEGRKMVADLDMVACPCKKNFVLAGRRD